MIKNKKNYSVKEIFEEHIKDGVLVYENKLRLLNDIIRYFRPKNVKKSISLLELIGYLSENPQHCALLAQYVRNLLIGRQFGRMISDVGISQDSSFLYELKKRVLAKILPYQPEKDTMEYVLNQVFYKESDILWIEKIDYKELEMLYDQLGFEDIFTENSIRKGALNQILNAIGLISQRMSGRSLESDMIRMAPEYSYLESPFLSLEKELYSIQQQLNKGENLTTNDLAYKQLMLLHKQCLEFVNHSFKNASKYGITLRVNQGLLRIRQQLQRIEILINLLIVNEETDKKRNSILLALKLIEYNCYKNNVKTYLDDSVQSVAYEITQFTAVTGEKYITETASEYFKMFKASVGAGLIVGFLCIFKALLASVDTSIFGHAFLYSMNYAFGFILIYLTGAALATKQPAMTATTVIRTIEEGMKNQGDEDEKHTAFAQFFARLMRSQFIAFVGNVIMAFVVALGLVWCFEQVFQYNLVASPKWEHLLKDASPAHSLLIFHAGIAGVFLFLSGIIAGNVSNSNKHNQVYYRIQENPFLKRTFGKSFTKKVAKWLEKKYPGIISNFWFGVFMGSTAAVGTILGLNLDIRHITFVSGNISMGLYGANFTIEPIMWLWLAFGVILTGFMNFIVSFGLSIWLAFRSRNIPFTEVKLLIKSVLKHFKKHPMSFIFPPRQKNIQEA
ncbi:MAG: recombinase [Capnocytophaga sp.]|nr:recombinase [Capnocytophaga sp.]